MRAFETIIESRVSVDKERLYFLNKYTSGKANDVIKDFVTLKSNDSYKKAKRLLTQRFGDPIVFRMHTRYALGTGRRSLKGIAMVYRHSQISWANVKKP